MDAILMDWGRVLQPSECAGLLIFKGINASNQHTRVMSILYVITSLEPPSDLSCGLNTLDNTTTVAFINHQGEPAVLQHQWN